MAPRAASSGAGFFVEAALQPGLVVDHREEAEVHFT
jgi:hypothetical protein